MARRSLLVSSVLLIALLVMYGDVWAEGPVPGPRATGGSNVDVVLLVDRSGSMKASDPENLRMLAAEFFVCLARPGDRIGVVGFDDRLDPVEPLRLLVSQVDKDALVSTIEECTARRYTDISQALREGFDQLSQSPSSNPKGVILLTDGRHTTGPYEYEAALYRDRGWKIHAVGWGGDVDIDFLRDISSLTGGQYFYGFSCAALRSIYRGMAGYEPRAPECDALCQQLEERESMEARGRIRGIVYHDVDRDGVFGPDEGGLADVGVSISSGAWSTFVVTAWNGSFEFPGLSVGYYDVEITVPEAYASTSKARVERIPVERGHLARSGVDFGLARRPEEQPPTFMPVTGADPGPPPQAATAFARSLPPGANIMREELPSGAVVLKIWVRGYPAGEYSLR